MLEIGNEAQIKSELQGKTGLGPEMENELIRRIAITEKEQDTHEPLGKAHWTGLALTGVIGVVLAIISLV